MKLIYSDELVSITDDGFFYLKTAQGLNYLRVYLFVQVWSLVFMNDRKFLLCKCAQF